jgi:hypothetical protein
LLLPPAPPFDPSLNQITPDEMENQVLYTIKGRTASLRGDPSKQQIFVAAIEENQSGPPFTEAASVNRNLTRTTVPVLN